MKHGKIYVAGIGPGSEEDITPAVRTAIMQSDVVVGYKYYFNFIRSIVRPETVCIDTGMKKEKDRSEEKSSPVYSGIMITSIRLPCLTRPPMNFCISFVVSFSIIS